MSATAPTAARLDGSQQRLAAERGHDRGRSGVRGNSHREPRQRHCHRHGGQRGPQLPGVGVVTERHTGVRADPLRGKSENRADSQRRCGGAWPARACGQAPRRDRQQGDRRVHQRSSIGDQCGGDLYHDGRSPCRRRGHEQEAVRRARLPPTGASHTSRKSAHPASPGRESCHRAARPGARTARVRRPPTRRHPALEPSRGL